MENKTDTQDAKATREISRRSFIKVLTLSGGAVMVGSWLAACGVSNETASAPTASGALVVDLTKPENKSLAEVGGTLALDNNPVDSVGLFLYRASGTSVQAFSRKCTHQGCQVNAFQQGVATCPCHGSQFDLSGKPLKGPATQTLMQYSAVLKGTELTVSAG